MKQEKENLHKDHRARMRKKFDKVGFEGWSKHEVIEYMLYNVYSRKDTNPVAHNILNYNMNSLVRMFENSKDMRMAENVEGVGEKTVQFLRTVKAFVDYYRTEELKEKPVLLTSDKFLDVIHSVDLSLEREELIMICLNRFLYVKSVVKVTEYSEEGYAVAYADRIVRIATQCGAKNVILAHTHPSGNADVSLDDIHMTVKLDKMFEALQINMIDHYVVSGDDVVSIKVTAAELEKRGTPLKKGERYDVRRK